MVEEQRKKELDKKILAFLRKHKGQPINAMTIAYALEEFDRWNDIEAKLYSIKAEGKVKSMRVPEIELFLVV